MSEPDKNQWYVVHVLSGQEQKVYENLTRRVKTEEMGDLVYEVLIPTERVSEIKRGKRTQTTRTLGRSGPPFPAIATTLVYRTYFLLAGNPGTETPISGKSKRPSSPAMTNP